MTVVLSKKMAAFTEHLSTAENNFQKEAFERLQEMDFPTTRNEYWKYTRLGKISNTTFNNNPVQKSELDFSSQLISENYVVIENGSVREELSSFETTEWQITFKNVTDAVDSENFNTLSKNEEVFNVLNAAQFTSLIHLKAKSKTVIEKPLQLIFVGHGAQTMSNHRVLIEAEKFSKATVIYNFVSMDQETQFDNIVSEFFVAENAHLTINKLQTSNASNLNVSTENIRQEGNSTFKINTITLNGLLQRNNINIAVDGENCETFMNGAIITKGKQHIDNHTFVDHKVPNCYSNENYKYVLDDSSTGVFNGRVVVRPDAQVINAYQNNGNILLSDNASINSKPELEIYADDVKCSHGSTTGQLDEDALFYLQTRGISKKNARKLLVSAFVGEVIESIADEKVIEFVQKLLKQEHGWDF